MDVVLAIWWNIKVDNKVNVGNIQPPASDVCSNQDVFIPGLEFIQSRKSLLLTQLPIDIDSFEIQILQN